MALTNDDLVLCYNKGKGLFLWSMEREVIISSTSKVSTSYLCFSGDGKKIAAATENPSSIVVYKNDELDKPIFRYKFISRFSPLITCIKDTNTFFVGCHDSIYYIDPAKDTVIKIYQTDDGYCKYLTYNNSRVFVVFGRMKSNEYSSVCVELLVRLSENVDEAGEISPDIIEIKSYDMTETAEWFVETSRGEKYIATNGLTHKIYCIAEDDTMEKVYELSSFVGRCFVSGEKGIAGIVVQNDNEETIRLISLKRNAKQIFERKEPHYICYPSISNSGNYLLIPHTKESKIVSIKDLDI